jgi:outer membrane protein OmpA-like peptidoglycan-associated protein
MMRRVFGAALDAMPEEEARFVLQFDEARDTLNAEAMAMIPAILKAIADRRSTDIRVTGHTDTTGTIAANLALGQRRAETVAALLRAQGVAADSLYVTSYGEVDQVVKTARGTPEPRNRRVEVIVH